LQRLFFPLPFDDEPFGFLRWNFVLFLLSAESESNSNFAFPTPPSPSPFSTYDPNDAGSFLNHFFAILGFTACLFVAAPPPFPSVATFFLRHLEDGFSDQPLDPPAIASLFLHYLDHPPKPEAFSPFLIFR